MPATITLSINGGELRAEVADDADSRRLGLSYRQHLPPNSGMLLAFPMPSSFCLWMRDVYFDLGAAFLDAHGTVISTVVMKQQTKDLHCSPKPAQYAVETPVDWLQKYHVRPGDMMLGLPPASDSTK